VNYAVKYSNEDEINNFRIIDYLAAPWSFSINKRTESLQPLDL
jgi:hypothetical protein